MNQLQYSASAILPLYQPIKCVSRGSTQRPLCISRYLLASIPQTFPLPRDALLKCNLLRVGLEHVFRFTLLFMAERYTLGD